MSFLTGNFFYNGKPLSSAPLCVPHDVDSWFVATPI